MQIQLSRTTCQMMAQSDSRHPHSQRELSRCSRRCRNFLQSTRRCNYQKCWRSSQSELRQRNMWNHNSPFAVLFKIHSARSGGDSRLAHDGGTCRQRPGTLQVGGVRSSTTDKDEPQDALSRPRQPTTPQVHGTATD